jgi:hypothetical protein
MPTFSNTSSKLIKYAFDASTEGLPIAKAFSTA